MHRLLLIVLYDESVNSEGYCNILQEGVIDAANVLQPETYVLVNDNDTCQITQDARIWMRSDGILTFP